jgi:hypothetical protein
MCLIDQYSVYSLYRHALFQRLVYHHALFQRMVAPMTTDALVETNPEIPSERAQKGQQATKTVLLALKILFSCLYYCSVDDLALRL